MDLIRHWIDGAPADGDPARTGPVFNPASGQQAAQVALATVEDVDRAVASAAEAAFPEWRDAALVSGRTVLFAFRELLERHAGRLAAADHRRARQGARRRRSARSPRSGGRRVRLRHPQLLQGRVLRAGLHRVDVVLDPPAARCRRGHHAVQLPGDGAAVDVPGGHRLRQHVRAEAEREGPVGSLLLAELFAEAGLPDGVFNVVHGDKEAVDALLDHPDVAAVSFVGSTPIARHVYETRHRQPASGSRRSAGRRTTWWSCPTRTSTWPPTPRSRRRTARPASGAWRSRRWSRWAIGRRAGRRRSTSAWPSSGRPRHRPDAEMGPLVTARAPRQGRLVRRRGRRGGRRRRRRRPRLGSTATQDGLWIGLTPARPRDPRDGRYKDEIFGPVLSRPPRRDLRGGRPADERDPFGNGTAIFTNDGGAARRFQNEIEAGMVGINVPIPVPVAYYSFGGWKDRSSPTTRSTARRASGSTPSGRS